MTADPLTLMIITAPPMLLAPILYWLAGRKPAPEPTKRLRIAGYVLGAIPLMFNSSMALSSGLLDNGNPRAIEIIVSLLLLNLPGILGVAVLIYLFWRQRLLLCWGLASVSGVLLFWLAGMAFSMAPENGLGNTVRHGLEYGIVLGPSWGPLLALPFGWIWHVRAARAAHV